MLKAIGLDNILVRFLRDVAGVFLAACFYTIDLSLKTSTVPDDFKTTRVVPVYKTRQTSYDGKVYGLVSILPVV